MKYNFVYFIITSLLITSQSAFSQSESRFSPKGIKGAISTASFDIISERGLKEGDGGSLSLGWGFTDRFSLWLSLFGSEHRTYNSGNLETNFGGIELNIQHKFKTTSRWQPYGKLGFGVYALEEKDSDVTLLGAGINLAVGLDFFFAKHFGIGAEFMFKKLDYFDQIIEQNGGDLVIELNPRLNGDTGGFMLSLIIQ